MYSLVINFNQTIFFSLTLFCIGCLGIILNKKSLIVMLMSIEILLVAVNYNFVLFSYYHNDIAGQVFSLFILTVAAAESAIGLAILVSYYRIKNTILVDSIKFLKN